MESTTTDQLIVNNDRIYLIPHSIAVSLLEKELIEKDIQYHTYYLTIKQIYIVFTFFEKDMPIVYEILGRISRKLTKQHEFYEKEKQKKKAAERKTVEYRQQAIAKILLLLIISIVFLAIIL